jgi:phosphatidylinositol-3-phosphatase
MKFPFALFALLVLAAAAEAGNLPPIQTVFVIVMENHNWSDIEGSRSAPYINGMLLPMASYCEQYYNPPGMHPSLPNYLWLETGTNFGITVDNPPSINHQSTTNHLVTLLANAEILWRAYQEDIAAGYVPLDDTNNYAVRHDPFAYFDDVTGTNDYSYPYGIAHIRPYTELAADLTNNNVARYNFITPNLIDDGHNAVTPDYDSIQQIDDWLAVQIPVIMQSSAYSNNGAIFITWDEGVEPDAPDGPIGMIVLSPLARGGGYTNNIYYTHSSCLRTMQEIFGVTPLLGDAANATDLSDLFNPFAVHIASINANGTIQLLVTGATAGKTNFVQTSTDLLHWQNVSTNLSPTTSFMANESCASNVAAQFYRVEQLP